MVLTLAGIGTTSPLHAQADAAPGDKAQPADAGVSEGEAPAEPTSTNGQLPAPSTEQPSNEEGARLREAQATRDTVRGVLAGGAVALVVDKELERDAIPIVTLYEASRGPPPARKPSARCGVVPPKEVSRRGTALCVASVETITADNEVVLKCPANESPCQSRVVANIPRDMPEGHYQVQMMLEKNNTVLPRPQRLRVVSQWWVLGWSALPIAFGALLVWLLLRERSIGQDGTLPGTWSAVLIDPATRTYSLSRAQFLLWSSAITTAYVFLFVAGGIVDSHWQFPSMEGFALTFLISLGTLVGAEATTQAKGSKGAGAFRPSWSDLIVHGGVLALERVQQLLWTLIAVGMFLLVVYKDYAEAKAIPSIPNELLILMGVSSAGYLGGKLARSAGPVIEKVEISSEQSQVDGTLIEVSGRRLAKSGSLLVDGSPCTGLMILEAELPEDGRVPNPDLARKLRALVSGQRSAFEAKNHTIRLTNPDGQHAEWVTQAKIEKVEVNNNGAHSTLSVTGLYLASATVWEVEGAVRIGEPVAIAKGWRLAIELPDEQKPLGGSVIGTLPNGQQVRHAWCWTPPSTARTPAATRP